jgi:hypothetical protein
MSNLKNNEPKKKKPKIFEWKINIGFSRLMGN